MSHIEELQRFVDECYKEEDKQQIEESPPLESQLSAKKRSLHKSSQEEEEEAVSKIQRVEEEAVSKIQRVEEEAVSKIQRVEEDFSEESEEEVRKPRPRRLVMSDSSD